MCSFPSLYDFFMSDDTGRIQSGQSHSDPRAIHSSLTVEEGLELRGGVFPRGGGRWALWPVKKGGGGKHWHACITTVEQVLQLIIVIMMIIMHVDVVSPSF